MSPLQGQCACGAVKIEVAALAGSILCSCTKCRAVSGSLFSVNYRTPSSSLQLLSEGGEANLTTYHNSRTNSGRNGLLRFCSTCESPVYSKVEGGSEVKYVKGGLPAQVPSSSIRPPLPAQLGGMAGGPWRGEVLRGVVHEGRGRVGVDFRCECSSSPLNSLCACSPAWEVQLQSLCNRVLLSLVLPNRGV